MLYAIKLAHRSDEEEWPQRSGALEPVPGAHAHNSPAPPLHLGKRVGKELVYMGRSEGLVPHHRKPNRKQLIPSSAKNPN
jgi:hypothetical protein